MIHILQYILKVLATGIMCLTITTGSVILSILFWDGFYIDKAGEYFDHLWEL